MRGVLGILEAQFCLVLFYDVRGKANEHWCKETHKRRNQIQLLKTIHICFMNATNFYAKTNAKIFPIFFSRRHDTDIKILIGW